MHRIADISRAVAVTMPLLFAFAGASAQELPPEVRMDRYMVQVDRQIEDEQFEAALRTLDQALELQEAYGLEVSESFWMKRAEVAIGAGDYTAAIGSATRYLEIAGRGGDRYFEALVLLDQAVDGAMAATLVEPEVEADRPQAAASAREAGGEASATAAAPAAMHPGTVFWDCVTCPDMVVVPSGSFMMGSPASEEGRQAHEGPRHRVTIESPFAVGVYEVTHAEWEACAVAGGCWTYRPNDLGWGRGSRPVLNVSWEDAQEYLRWLSMETGEQYRLLTEAEWEYVARAGAEGPLNWGDAQWLCSHGNAFDKTAGAIWTVLDARGDPMEPADCSDEYAGTSPAGSFPANGFGLYDVLGNVEEWTQDCWNQNYSGAPADGSAWESGDCEGRALRGGGWTSGTGSEVRLAARYRHLSVERTNHSGFRVARNVDPAAVAAAELEAEAADAAAVPAEAPTAATPSGTVFRECAVCPEMVVVPSGSFVMGSPASEEGRSDQEGPQHRVTMGSPFAAGVYEVTFAQWDACLWAGGCGGLRPLDGGWGRESRPVIHVSWEDAQDYVRWLSRETGHRYRLLTEAEWEYVARAGTRTARYWGESGSEQCRYENGSDDTAPCPDGYEHTAPVGSFQPNAFGLYDVLGNAWEWTQDCWNEDYSGAPGDGSAWQSGDCSVRVLRAGSAVSPSWILRSANRYGNSARDRFSDFGFRVARTLSESPER